MHALLLLLTWAALGCGAPTRHTETGTGTGVATGAGTRMRKSLQQPQVNPETLQQLVTGSHGEHTVREGDVMMMTDRNAIQRVWPTPKIPYVISQELTNRTEDIHVAMAMVSEDTCLSFHPRTNETDFLLLKVGHGCASFVGQVGGGQPVFVGPTCWRGNIAHELLHAAGFYHEHTRADRGGHILVLSHNIIQGMEKNFEMQEGQTFSLPYDIQSILHYGGYFFSANGLPTIVSTQEVEGMGQRDRLTQLDSRKVRLLYGCDIKP